MIYLNRKAGYPLTTGLKSIIYLIHSIANRPEIFCFFVCIEITVLYRHYRDRIFRRLRRHSGFPSSLFLNETVWNSCGGCGRIFRLESSIRQTMFHLQKYFRKTGQRTAAVQVHRWDLRDCSRCMVPHSR